MIHFDNVTFHKYKSIIQECIQKLDRYNNSNVPGSPQLSQSDFQVSFCPSHNFHMMENSREQKMIHLLDQKI